MVVLGVPAALLGAVLPLWMREKDETGVSLGDRVGRLLTWNTCGAVVGVLLTGFVFMPGIGLRGSFGLLALLLSTVALAMAAWQRRPVTAVAAVTLAGLLAFILGTAGEGWRHVMSSGVFRARETEVDLSVMQQRKNHIKILFYQDAADATVTVTQGDGKGASDERVLCTNGKPEATSRGDLATQYLVGHLPLLAKPDSQDVFVVGLGSGITAGAALGHPIRRMVVAENCEPVIRAAGYFNDWNQGVLTNAKATILLDDARTVLKLNRQRYDVIISEPSNPWFAGTGSVFSREFYQLLASRLKEGGIVAQWLQVYETSDEIVALVLRTFQSVFPHVEVWDACSGDLVLLGSEAPWPSGPEVWRKTYERAQPRRNLEQIGLPTPEILWARQLASQRTAFAIVGPGPIQTDELPRIEYDAPKAFYLGRRARMLMSFDERTTQATLAPKAKTAALSQLPAEALRGVFGQYQSINPDVQRCVTLLSQAAENPAYRQLLLASLPTQTLFLAGSTSNELVRLPTGQTPLLARLTLAREKLDGGSPEWEQAAALIEETIRVQGPALGQQEGGLAGAYLAAAGRVSLRHGDLARAGRLIEAGLAFNPGNPELSYLKRIAAKAQD